MKLPHEVRPAWEGEEESPSRNTPCFVFVQSKTRYSTDALNDCLFL